MDLFNNSYMRSLLPYDGETIYYGRVLKTADAEDYFHTLLHGVEWKNDEAVIFGKHIVTKRKVAWYGDSAFSYTYSNTTKEALPWTKELLALKKLAEELSQTTFNSCLLNLYHNGEEGMAWHSDDEKSLGKNTAIASVSLGAERTFALKHKKTGFKTSLVLEHGSLLLMRGATQSNWLHSLPKSKKVKRERVNLTFRTMVGQ